MPPTPRQLEIIALCASGKTREEIGVELMIAPRTIQQRLDDLRERIGARTVAHAVSICIASGWLCVDGRECRVFVPELFEDIAA